MNEQRPDIQKLIEEDKKERLTACMEAINKALEEYNCAFKPQAEISQDGRIIPSIKLEAN